MEKQSKEKGKQPSYWDSAEYMLLTRNWNFFAVYLLYKLEIFLSTVISNYS